MVPAERIPRCLRQLWRKGIGFRIVILVALIMLPFGALLGTIFHQRYQMRMHSALQTETEVAQGLALTTAAHLRGISIQALAAGDAIFVLTPVQRGRIAELLISSARHSPSVLNFSWVSPAGAVLGSSAPQKTGVDLSKKPYFAEAAAGRDMVVGDLEARGAISGKPCIPLATAIRDSMGRFQGAVIAEIEPATLGRGLLYRRRPSDVILSLFDRHGALVYHSSPPWEKRGGWRQRDPMLMRVQSSGMEEAGRRPGVRPGEGDYLSALVPVEGVGWIAGASRPARVALGEVERGTVVDASFGAAVLALAFLFAYLLGRNIVAPMRRLEHDAVLMGGGMAVPLVDPFAPREVASLRATMLAMTADMVKRATALQESEELLRAVFQNVYDGVLIHDPEGRIVEVNERWLKMVDIDKEQVEGLTIRDISADPPPDEELRALWREVIGGQTKFFEWRTRRPRDGTTFDVEVFLCPIRLKGKETIMACVRDITERKRTASELQRYKDELELRVRDRTEELRKAVEEIQKETAQRVAAVEELRRKEQLLIQQSRLAAMGEMMGNIAHQWRQPLNVLGLIVQELKISHDKGVFTEELLTESVAKAMKVIGHMSQTIDDFRNLLSPDKAKVVFDAREVIEKVLSMLQPRAKVEVSAREQCPMEGSRNEFSQVILNIIANAHDVFRDRKVENPEVTIRLFRDSGRSVVTIADNGGGIEGDIMDRIFDPYFTTKGPDKGTGLGLFMSKTIIEKSMGGRLTVHNTGEGAEFRIEVPSG